MNTTVLVVMAILVAAAFGWLARRKPIPRATVLSAAAAFVAALVLLSRPDLGGAVHIVASLLAPSMAMVLFVAGMRRLNWM